MVRTSSADPAQLEAAANAVTTTRKADLSRAPAELSFLMDRFNRAEQVPELHHAYLGFDLYHLHSVVAHGEAIDDDLVRVASAFRTAGAGRTRPPGFTGPWVPLRVLTLNDVDIRVALSRWHNDPPAPLDFRRRDDGRWEVEGPDGHWFVMAQRPPTGVPSLGRVEQTVDLANPDWQMQVSAFALIGFTGGATQPAARSAPPEAYRYLHFDDDGYPFASPEITGWSEPLRPPTVNDAGTDRWDGLGLVQGGLSEGIKGMSTRYSSVVHTQTNFYVDPRTNERVAVVVGGQIRYDNDSNDAIVSTGVLQLDDQGRPVLMPRGTTGGAPAATKPANLTIPTQDH